MSESELPVLQGPTEDIFEALQRHRSLLLDALSRIAQLEKDRNAAENRGIHLMAERDSIKEKCSNLQKQLFKIQHPHLRK